MNIQTLGHASLLIKKKNKPLLMTDPWFFGSSYWNSWGLKRYPTKSNLKDINKVKFAFITHEHKDHLHPETIQKLNKKIKYLIPNFKHNNVKNFFKDDKSLNYKILKKEKWYKLDKNLKILYIPLWRDDTILIIRYKNKFILNINDAYPNKLILNKIKKITKLKKLIILQSYSPASLINSIFLNNKRLIFYKKIFFYKKIEKVCSFLEANFFIPFASQVFFMRKDSKWANSFSVKYEDLKKYWSNKTKLLPEYSNFDLDNEELIKNIHKKNDKIQINKIVKKIKSEKNYFYNKENFSINLKKKMSSLRIFLIFLFPRGLVFSFSDKNFKFKYLPLNDTLLKDKFNKENYSINIHAPYGPVHECIINNFLEDVGIGMFTKINVKSKYYGGFSTYIFFNVLLPLAEHNHLSSIKRFRLWINNSISSMF
jgi:hypothetical protein